jgi:hypothetical protein
MSGNMASQLRLLLGNETVDDKGIEYERSTMMKLVLMLSSKADTDYSFLLIPGIGSPSAETWPFCNQNWLEERCMQENRRIRVFSFEYSIPMNDSFSWETVLIHGHTLLQLLAEKRATVNLDQVRCQILSPFIVVSKFSG